MSIEVDLKKAGQRTLLEDQQTDTPMIQVAALGHSYQAESGQTLQVLDDIQLTIQPGEFVAIVGPSGCGKTTLLNIIAGLERHSGAGELTVDGAQPRAGNHDVGYMLARDSLLPWRRAIDNAGLALEMQGVGRRERQERARAALVAVGLEPFTDAYPAQLSQGMRQRVALARVFAAAPRILLLDEPFSALDAQTRVLVQDTFLRVWERERTTGVLVTHDLSEAVALADRVIIMSRRPGCIRAIRTIDLPRPRSASGVRSDPHFHELYEPLWQDLSQELGALTSEEGAR